MDRKRLPALIALLVAATLASQSPGNAQPSTPVLDGATLINGGSTNTSPYRIALHSDGTAVLTIEGKTPETKRVSAATAAAFFAQLKATLPLVQTAGSCMKSASFGTTTSVAYHGKQSGDLSCSQAVRDRTLMSTITNIANEIGIGPFVPRHGAPAPEAT